MYVDLGISPVDSCESPEEIILVFKFGFTGVVCRKPLPLNPIIVRILGAVLGLNLEVQRFFHPRAAWEGLGIEKAPGIPRGLKRALT